jgi:hypothetical protein
MIVDKNTRFSNSQAVTATAVSENVLDLGAIRNMGTGARPLYLVVQVTVAMTDAASDSTITVTIETDTLAAFGSATVSQTVSPVFAALSAIGERRVVQVAPEAMNEAFARLRYTTTNGDLTTGSFTAFLTPDPQLYTAYAKNYTVSTT